MTERADDWTAGYIADLGYTYGYYEELNPHRAALPLLMSGVLPPAKYEAACELGFGQGVSINVHAAAGPTQWFGTDFNPEQTAFAREMADASKTTAKLYDESFAEFCARTDLPDFDFIGLHGIWSWISDDNRRVLADFLRRKLKVGGLVYVSYNTQPGWSTIAPVRELMSEYVRWMGTPAQPLTQRVDAALDFAARLLASGSAYAKANPEAVERFERLRKHDRAYLAHEYFNRDWLPMSFADMSRWMGGAKLTFASTAALLGLVEPLNLNAAAAEFLKGVPHPEFRETVRDMLMNQQFRRDYWVRGARRPGQVEINDRLRALRVVLVTPADAVSMTLSPPGSQAKVPLLEGVYKPLLDAMSDRTPMTIGEIESKQTGAGFAQVLQALLILASRGDVALLQDESSAAAAQPHCDALNGWMLEKSRSGLDVGVLASPLTGGGMRMSRTFQLLLDSYRHGVRGPEPLARAAWQRLAAAGQRVVKDGRQIETEAENLEHLTGEARVFLNRMLPVLQILHVEPA